MLLKRLLLINLTELYIEDLNDYKNYRKRIHISEVESCILPYFESKKSTKYKNVVTKSILVGNEYPILLSKFPILL